MASLNRFNIDQQYAINNFPMNQMEPESVGKDNDEEPNQEALKESPKATAASEDQSADESKDDPDDVACNWHPKCQPQCCQCFARPSCLLLWLCLSSFTQGLVVNGFVNSVLTTLELRYDLTSSESGLIASMYDIGSVLCLVPVTYIGHRYRRSRVISIGLLIMGVGSFVFSIPQFSTDAYNYQSPVSPLCYLSGKTYPDFCTKQTLNNYKFVFWLGQFLHGVGASPLYTLGVAYLDDNLTVQQSGAFLGAYYAMSLIGPAMGYLLGGIFLNIFVELGVTPTEISPKNTNLWVGAWWVGFLLSGTLSLIAVVPIFGFPRKFPKSTTIRKKRRNETHRDSGAIQISVNDLWSSSVILLKNPTFLFLSCAGATQYIIMTGLSTFGPKILQTLFYLTPSSSTITMGLVTVPGAAFGVMAGGLVIRFTNFSARRLLWLSLGVALLDIIFGLGFFARCNLQSFAGVNRNYPLTPNQPDLLNATCNKNCNCQESKFLYSPVCGADSTIYYSPCYAGCQNNGTVIDGVKYYANCTCVSGQIPVAKDKEFSAVEGACTDKACEKLQILLSTLFLFVFLLFSTAVPILQCTMRVIPARLKDFGLGLQWVILRLFGSIPGPPLLGILIDTTCNLWTGGCGRRGSCSFYNGGSFWVMVIAFTGVLKVLEICLLALAAGLYISPEDSADATSATAESTSGSSNN